MGTETVAVYVCDICGHRSTDPLERGSAARVQMTVTARGYDGNIGGANLTQWWCGACWDAFCHWRADRIAGDNDIDPEGFTRYGGDCICGPVYTYAGIPEPGGFAPDCPMHADAVPTDELVWTDFADVPPGTLVSCDNDFLWLLRTKNGGWWVEGNLPKDKIAALKDQRDGWGITPSLNRSGPFRFKAHV